MKKLKAFRSLSLAVVLFAAIISCTSKSGKDPEFTGYLFAHMTNDHYGRLYYSLSRDGKEWQSLNGGEIVLDGYLGHPNIVRGDACGPTDDFSTGECFYMMGVSTSGHLRHPIIWYSRDLVQWHHKDLSRDIFDVSEYDYVNEDVYLGAPKIFYDKDNARYIVTWHAFDPKVPKGDPLWESMRTFYFLTSDWEHFTKPRRLFEFDGGDASMATIDVILNKENGRYYALIKDERWPETVPTGKTIRIASSDSLTGPYSNPGPSITGAWEEAPVAVRKNDGSGWLLFTERYLIPEYCSYEAGSFDSPEWTPVEIAAPHQGRHGCVIPITEEEYQALSIL